MSADEFWELVRDADRAAAPGADEFIEDVRSSLEHPRFAADQRILSDEKRLPNNPVEKLLR